MTVVISCEKLPTAQTLTIRVVLSLTLLVATTTVGRWFPNLERAAWPIVDGETVVTSVKT